jgi:choline dehydrogenase
LKLFILEELEPGLSAKDDAAMLAHAPAAPIFHPTSTCLIMAPATNPDGIEVLRIADASIMPTVVSGNTNAAAS